MQRRVWMAGLAGGLTAAALASSALAAPEPVERLCGPPGMRLGMSVDAWKALAFPGAGAGVVQPVCSDDPLAANFLGVKAADAPGTPVVCGYANRIGSVFLRNSITVLGGYRAERLRYVFPAGRLTEIDCVASDDAFDAAHARFDRLYGPSKHVVRDTVSTETGRRPRVRESWPIPGGSITLTDPADPPTDLLLQYKASGS